MLINLYCVDDGDDDDDDDYPTLSSARSCLPRDPKTTRMALSRVHTSITGQQSSLIHSAPIQNQAVSYVTIITQNCYY